MTQTQIKPRDKLRRWASRNDLSVMPLCQILSNIERIGIDAVTMSLVVCVAAVISSLM